MAKHRTQVLHEAFEWELNRERAATLGRAAHRLEKQLRLCQRLLHRLDAEDDPAPEALEAYRSARDECERLRWTLCVQREVVGLIDHRPVHRTYPLPPRR